MKTSNCANCKYGRRACAPNMVACAYQFKHNNTNYQAIMVDLELDTVSIGWGYMQRAVDDKKGEVLGSGIMTNNVVIFERDFCCKHYEVGK